MVKLIFIVLVVATLFTGVILWQIKSQSQNTPPVSDMEAVKGEAVITIMEEGFSPSEVKIKVGSAVRFVNKSKQWHWPASDLHPTHTLYPEFDPKKTIGPGEEWTFTFEKTGEWGFHDHLGAYLTGTVIVVK